MKMKKIFFIDLFPPKSRLKIFVVQASTQQVGGGGGHDTKGTLLPLPPNKIIEEKKIVFEYSQLKT